MRKLSAIGLMLAIGWQPLSAAGPIERSISREAGRLAGVMADEPDRSGWHGVRLLKPRSSIVVTTADTTITGAFVSVSDTILTVSEGSAVRQISVDDVEMVERRMRRGSAGAAVAGTLAGLALAPWVAYAMVGERSGSLAAVGVLGVTIGIPTAFGYGSWRGTSQLTEEVIYRRTPARR